MNTKLQGNETNLVAYYSFDDGTATALPDSTYNGTLYNNPTFIQERTAYSQNFIDTTASTFTVGAR